jgi:hypothetical protein
MNALKHGLSADPERLIGILLKDEDPAEFAAFYQDLTEAYAPQTPWEALLVRRLVVTAWRLERAWRATAQVTDHEREYNHYHHWSDPKPERRLRSLAWAFRANGGELSQLERYESTLMRYLNRTEEQLLKLKRRPLPDPETAEPPGRGEPVDEPLSESLTPDQTVTTESAPAGNRKSQPVSRSQTPVLPNEPKAAGGRILSTFPGQVGMITWLTRLWRR